MHTLPGLAAARQLQRHPAAGASWVGFVADRWPPLCPRGSQLGFSVDDNCLGRSPEVTASDFYQELGHGLVQLGQILVHRSPDFGAVQPGIAMHQSISEADQLALARHPRAKHRVQPGQLAHGFADVLQLPFNR